MKIQTFEDQESWLAGRIGKITGSKLGEIYSSTGKKKIGFYQLIADRLGIPPDGQNAMDRGHELEPEALTRFQQTTGLEVDTSLVLWTRDDNDSIALSPDGFIGTKEAVEVKCLGSARHIEALLTNKIPSDYEEQVLQYFIVNDELETLHFVFFDPRILAKDFFEIVVTRDTILDPKAKSPKTVQEQVDELLTFQYETLKEVDDIVARLTDF